MPGDREDMKHAEKMAPVAAALSALTTLACCLPIAFAAGTATAGLAAVAGSYRWWFLGASAILLAVGALQLVRVRRCVPDTRIRLNHRLRDFGADRAAGDCFSPSHRRAHSGLDAMTRRRLLVAPIVLLAALGAGTFAWVRFATHYTPAGQPPLATLDNNSLATLKADFNRASGETRIIALLSPT